MKNIQRNFKSHHALALLGVIVLATAIVMYSGRKGVNQDGMGQRATAAAVSSAAQYDSAGISAPAAPARPAGQNEEYASAQGIQSSQIGLPPSCSRQPVTDPADLLPKDTNSQWAQLNPGTSNDMNDVNFLKSGYHQGIDTIGSSLRNANLQVRSEPPNPQVKVSPWQNTTIEPDLMRVPLEMGCGPQ